MLLANVYLHYVFDLWAHRWRHREATGNVIIVRYADDFIVGFEHESDARRFWIAVRDRLEEFSVERVRRFAGTGSPNSAIAVTRMTTMIDTLDNLDFNSVTGETFFVPTIFWSWSRRRLRSNPTGD